MASQQLDEEAIFHIARDLSDPTKRATYLDQVCAGDQALRERVEGLLQVHGQEQSFLKSNGDPPPTQAMGELNITTGQQIGRYKLLQKIGEGGFGVVFMAEQSRPVRRKVALKVIKPGMDTQAVVARFEAERQALAMMDHPNIARVFDGGETEGGRPYFVMELVKGVSITDYCDKNELSTEQRLKLFTTVCQAVQHAHQKGIIHRDLKPSNVLVTLADGKPVVKVIDFGVAKATNQQLTERTMFTAFGQMVGTPQYMSPEQAEMSCLDVDTRSDVYSLGVLLYELLTGTTPLEAERLRTAGYAEMRRMIRDEEPPKPSTRLSTSGDKLTIIAKHRNVTPEKLKSQVKGDLDWIVMKALEKDRNRRYGAPASLGDDVERVLSNEPVEACPPSRIYRAKKFIRRNRILVSTASFVVIAWVCGLGATTWGMKRAKVSAQVASEERNRANGLLKEVFELAVREAMLKSFEGNVEGVRELVDKYQTLFSDRNIAVDDHWPTVLLASAHLHAGNCDKVDELLSPIVDSSTDEPPIPAIAILSTSCLYRGEWNRPVALANRLRAATPRPQFSDIDKLFLGYGMIFIETDKAVRHIEAVLEDHPNWLICHALLADALIHQGNFRGDQAMTESAYQKSTAILELMTDNPLSLNVALLSHKCMIEWRQEAGLPYDDLEYTGMEIAARFRSKWSEFPLAHQMSAQFYETVNKEAEADDAWFAALRTGREMPQWTAIGGLYRTRTSEEMIEILDREFVGGMSHWAQLARGYILADIPNGREEAIRIFEDALTDDSTMMDRYSALPILLLLGDKETARSCAAKWLDRWNMDPKRDNRSEVAEAELFEMVASGDRSILESTHRMNKSLANFYSGLLAICDGKSDAALAYLDESAEGPFSWFDPYWARAFRTHLEASKAWPRENQNALAE